MFRPKLLFTSLAALALGACSPQDPQAVTSAAIAKSVILPTYTRWVEADRQLAVSALAYCEGKENLDTARADFLHAQKAWAELQPLLIGPLAEGNRAWQVQFWPDKKTSSVVRSSNWSPHSRKSMPPPWPSPASWCKASRLTNTFCSTANQTWPTTRKRPSIAHC